MVGRTMAEISAANRRRYEELRLAGQEAAPKALPPATALDGAPIAAQAVVSREEVPPGWYDTVRLRRGEALRIIDPLGVSSVSLIGWCQHDRSERINCADTAKVQWSAALSKGRVILSDMGRVFLSLIEDTSGAHDLLMGGSTPASTVAAYGEVSRNTHENFLAAASKLGLGLRDIPPCVSFFAPVSLFFFFFLMLIITTLRGIELHPMNYFFLAASFFSFHLLMAYLVDHISIHLAFAICSAVSVALLVSYLRLVVGMRFAALEAGLAPVLYLILFSYAFFFEGFTGLAITIGAILTLFITMQMTARVRWSEKFATGPVLG